MNINELNNILVEYIEQNKVKYNIDYLQTIESLKELINELKKEYQNIEKD